MRRRGTTPLLVLGFALSALGSAFTTGAAASTQAPSAPAARVIVVLKTPHRTLADLPGVEQSRQRAAIDTTTASVDDTLQQHGGRVVRRFRSVPYAAVEASPAALAALRASNAVSAVLEDRLMAVADAESTPLVGATATHAVGFAGTGQSIAILDTGVDRSHPFLAGKVVDEACFSGIRSCPNGQATQVGPGAAAPCTYAPADCRHGTHVAGIAAGGPAAGVSFTGMAPAAKLVSVQVFSRFDDPICSQFRVASPCALTFNSDMLAGLEHVYDVASSLHVASVNMSIGGLISPAPCDGHVLKPAIDNLRAVGVATVIAAGNDGVSYGIAEPACISTAISVGATTKSDTIANYSNSASFLKLLAPGSSIRSSVPGGYADLSGTSMATPHVAGAFAVGRQMFPSETVAQLLFRMRYAGLQLTDPRNGVTVPRLEMIGSFKPTALVPGAVTVVEGDQIAIPVTLTRASTLPVTAHYQSYSYSATDGLDFVGGAGTVTFAPGTTATSAVVQGRADTEVEGDEIMFVAFTAPTNGALGGYYGLGFGTISDDD